MKRPNAQPTAPITVAHRELARMQRRLDLIFLRLVLQNRIRFISPILVDLMAGERVKLESMLFRIQPSARRRRHARQLMDHIDPALRWHYHLPTGWRPEPTRAYADQLFRDSLSARGVVVRPPSHPRGHLGISTGNDQLDAEFGDGEVRAWTHESSAFVHVRHTIPEQVGIALFGRPVGDVVEHPVLQGRDYPIEEVRIVEASEGITPSTTIRFHCGRLPFEMPFQRFVTELSERVGLGRRGGRFGDGDGCRGV